MNTCYIVTCIDKDGKYRTELIYSLEANFQMQIKLLIQSGLTPIMIFKND